MNGSATGMAQPYDFIEEFDIARLIKFGSTGILSIKKLFPDETQEIQKPVEEEKGKIIYKEMIKTGVPTAYLIFFSFFLSITILLGTFLFLSSFKNIILLDPFILFYGFLGSICLTVTNLVGIISKKKGKNDSY